MLGSRFCRRLITIPLFIGSTVLLTCLLPLLIVIAGLLTVSPSTRGALPTLGFVLGYLWCETLGILSALYIWLRYREHEAFLNANFKLQCWWANALKVIGQRLFRLSFRISGESALNGPPAILLPRHTSIADTILPMVFYAIPHGIRLRYVLKKELLIDPCLDIVGHRLPNCFVDRRAHDSAGERNAVARLMVDLQPNEGALIYPEGTRYSQAKHAALRQRYQASAEMLTQLERWTDLLPPRLGGTMAMLGANPGLDVIFLAHTGFEGSSHFRNLINGSWLGANINLIFWRVRFEDIPTAKDELREFLFTQWDRMQASVRNNP